MYSVDDIVKKCGGVSVLCEKLGISNQMTIRQWIQRNAIPAKWVIKIEKISGVSCCELRPDIYPPERFKHAS